jgi:alpha-L-fucosidase
MKYGVRTHWGLYTLAHFAHESWPLLDLSYAERAHYNEIYKTWNPTGFDANEWTSLFQNGMRMFAFTTKHHEGLSMFDTRTRLKQRISLGRARWTVAID